MFRSMGHSIQAITMQGNVAALSWSSGCGLVLLQCGGFGKNNFDWMLCKEPIYW
ncbi:hypothetical protein JN652_002013 [Vibrio cholerae]|nr:hypothetical protein [Vibrio cholerae]